MTTQSTIAHDIIDAFCAGDLEACRTLVAPDVVYEESGTGRRIQGADAYIDLLRGWRTVFPDVTGKVTSGIESGNQVALEITWSGTQDGPLPTPGGEIPASGRRIEAHSVFWCTVRNGSVTEIHNHIDMLTMLQQIGAIG